MTCPNLHWIHKSVAHRLLLLLQDPRHHCVIHMPSAKPFENNLNQIVQRFLETDCAFWLSIDDDNPPSRNPLDLVELDLDIVGLPTPIWHYTGKPGEVPIYFNAYSYDAAAGAYRQFLPQAGLQRVDAVGTGCILIHRRVFEHPDMQVGAFLRTWDDKGCVDRGNDIAFCERARAAGFTVHTHFGYPCDHFTELSLLEVLRAMRPVA